MAQQIGIYKELQKLAISTVSAPNGGVKVVNADGLTLDILNEVVAETSRSWRQVQDFSKHFSQPGVHATAETVWRYIRENIRYQLDPLGVQYIKTPARVIADGFADCKGYSILASSLLNCLGIENKLRFVAYNEAKKISHVYVVVFDGSKEILLDACLPQFNTEKPYTHKIDKMTRIVRLSGPEDYISATPVEIEPGVTSEADFELQLLRERLQLEKQIAQEINGIGTLLDRTYDYNLDMVENALAEIRGIGQIGFLRRIFKRKKGGTKVGNFLRKVTRPIKKATKVVSRAVTAPARLLAKGVLEVMLPKAAPFFLYLFVTNRQTLASMPAKAKRKRRKAEGISKFIINVIGMKQNHFMGIIRNGIMKHYRRTPEQVLSKMMKGRAITGIGEPVTIITAVVGILTKLFQVFKKKPSEGTPTINDMPDSSDWASLADTAQKRLPAPPKPKPKVVLAPRTTTQTSQSSTGTSSVRTAAPTQTTAARTTSSTSTATAPASYSTTSEESYNEPETQGKDNTMLYVGGAALLGLMLLKN
jgi:hypothetical protein